MKIKHRLYLSLLVSFIYCFLIEIFYILNISYISIRFFLNSIDNLLLKYLIFYFIESLFLFLISFLINKYYQLFKHKRVYFIISLILLLIQDFIMMFYGLNSEKARLQVELSQFFIIFLTSTLFFYSIYYENLLE